MRAKEIRELTIQEIEALVAEKKQELFKLRFQHALGQLENTAKLRQTKKDIARLYTILSEKRRLNDAK